MNYIVTAADGKQYGPVSQDTVRQWVAEGRVGPQTVVSREGENAGAPIRELHEFAGLFSVPVGPAEAPPPTLAPAPASGAEQPRTSRLAVASLVFGILGILLCGLTFIPAIICGHLAQSRIAAARGALTGKGMALAGLAAGYVSIAYFLFAIVLAGMLLPALGSAREKARRINCAANLKQIGLACKMYANDYSEAFPPDFKTLVEQKYLDAYKVYMCPSTSHTAGSSPEDVENPAHCDYLYFGAGHTEAEIGSEVVLACDRPGNHTRYFNLLFGDGHVASLPGNSLEDALQKNHARLPPGAAVPK